MSEGDATDAGAREGFTTEVAVRYTDVDTYGHVNNAAYATYCEEARIDYIETVLGESGRSIEGGDAGNDSQSGVEDSAGFVVANLTLDFERPLPRVDTVDVGVHVPRLGEKSIPFEYEIRSPVGRHATGETTVVAYDRERGQSRPIPDAWRERITEFEGL